MKLTGLDSPNSFNSGMTNFVNLILSIILQLWPVKFRIQKVKRLRLQNGLGGLHIGQSVEYAIWLPFIGWSSVRAVFRGTYAIPQWRVTEFQRDMNRDNTIKGSLYGPRQTGSLRRFWSMISRSETNDSQHETR